VRHTLLDERAALADASATESAILADAGTKPSAAPEASPVVAAIRKRKENR